MTEATALLIDGRVSQPPAFDLLTEAQRALGVWQSRLRLLDWDIWTEIGEVSDPHYAAQSSREWRMLRGRITFPADFIKNVRDKGECLPDETDAQLVENTVIHELLHFLEGPLSSRVDAEINWYVGDSSDAGGVIGSELRNSWRDYREWTINQVVRALLLAYAGFYSCERAAVSVRHQTGWHQDRNESLADMQRQTEKGQLNRCPNSPPGWRPYESRRRVWMM